MLSTASAVSPTGSTASNPDAQPMTANASLDDE
jgi:hypothetical protein